MEKWRNGEIRKEQLSAVNKWIASKKNCDKYEVMCGDFNDDPHANAHNFLMNSGWQDVVELSSKKDEFYYATFDLVK